MFPTGAVSVQGLLLPGPDQFLGGHTASAPKVFGCCSGQGRPSLYSVHLGWQPVEAALPPRGLCWFSRSLDSAEGQVLLPCAPACPEESPGVRQFGEVQGGENLFQSLLSSSCAAA